MPTLGWILETAEDRFYERGGDEIAREPAKLPCPICGATFDDALGVSWHVNEAHPLERPMLLVEGAPTPAKAIYSVPLDPLAIACVNTTAIRATCNGRVLPAANPQEVATRIASE